MDELKKAVMLRTVNFKFGQRLGKGEEVEITQEAGPGSYMVRRPSNHNLEFKVSRRSVQVQKN